MSVKLAGILAALSTGPLRRAVSVAAIAFLERVVVIIHRGAATNLAQIRQQIGRQGEAETRGKELDVDARNEATLKLTLQLEKEAAEIEAQRIKNAEATLELASKQGQAQLAAARRTVELARLERIRQAEEDVEQKLRVLRMKGASIGIDAEEVEALIAKLKSNSAPPQLDSPITDLQLSDRTVNALANLGMKTVAELVCLSKVEVLGLKDIGPVTLNEIELALEKDGLRLGMIRKPPDDTAQQAQG